LLRSWDEAYSLELQNFKDHGEEGEIWYVLGSRSLSTNGRHLGSASSARRGSSAGWANTLKRVRPGSSTLARAMVTCSCPLYSPLLPLAIGCIYRFQAKTGFSHLMGIDYSGNATLLGEALFRQNGLECPFAEVDFLDPDNSSWFSEEPKFDVVMDKGTFDAISLTPSSDARKDVVAELVAKFKGSLYRLLADEASVFIVTSCNWTREELTSLFGPQLKLLHQIDHPAFSFAGSMGQVVTSLVFKKAAH
jgi:EEF1A lysine methyltransferase 2